MGGIVKWSSNFVYLFPTDTTVTRIIRYEFKDYEFGLNKALGKSLGTVIGPVEFTKWAD